MRAGGAQDWTTNLLISGQPALPPVPQLSCVNVIHNLLYCFRGNVWPPMSLLPWKAVCTSCQGGASMRFGKSIYTRHALLMHELLNFIVPSSSSCNLNFSVSLLIHLSLSLTLSIAIIQSFARPLSRPILLTFFKVSAPVFQIHLCMDFNDLSGMNVLAVCVTYHT